ncbi:adenosylcobinamide-GDP ribazoletransferase [Paenibacillus sambharensis]|uniref:Adenosylcobinamide-GDP ribazoletransferase n=1 Tax=Paenibacillus sambharensis TaxID=1803190 RepID=A0A2W1LAH5_9BACL|nr:adenosylcobinamide-GDP ribazoletransferase [Paenibacillus sambharensis]PZD96226.1 adenosylcobinamide-GDP ribazoletransferase [Paenibacillus sambharensis]
MAVAALKSALQGLVMAVQFLTRFPVPVAVPFDQRTAAWSTLFFPVSGALIGLTAGGTAWLLAEWLPVLPAAVIITGLWTMLTGGLHMDGWMDTADGVLSHRSRERMLEIMKDSRVGAMGVIAAVLLLLFKFAAIAALLEIGRSLAAAAVLACVPVWSRWWMTVSIAGWPHARTEGLGQLYQKVGFKHASASAVTGLVVTAAIMMLAGRADLPGIYGWNAEISSGAGNVGAAGSIWLSLLQWPLLAVLFGLPLAWWLARKLGGQTGDTYGAQNEWVEAGLLLAAVIALSPA